MTIPALLALRLAAQRIAPRSESPQADGIAGCVRHLGAMQAQDYPAACAAIGLRTGATARDVEDALAQGRIVRTWPMRGTLHLVAAEDVRWMLALTAARVVASDAARLQRQFGIDERIAARSAEALARALQGGRRLTRTGAYEVLEAAGHATAGSRGLHILGLLAQQGVLCEGPREGRQPTFVLLDEWIAATPALVRDDALALLAQRYFRSHGPATAADFAYWSGLTLGDARNAVAAIAPQLQSLDTDADPAWFAGDAEPPPATGARAHLLPAFDEYLIGYRDRRAVLAARHAAQVISRNGLFSPVVLVDGQVAARWKTIMAGDTAVLAIAPLRSLRRADRAAVAAAARAHARFLGMPVDIDIGPVG